MIQTAVVILNWNGKTFLKKFLPGLLRSIENEQAEIFIADNGSTDGSVDFLQSVFPGIHCLLFDQNYGFTGGYNRALKQISANYYILLNSDIEVTEGWLHPLIATLGEDPETAAVMPKILDFNRRNYFEYAGAAGGYIDKLGYPFCRGRILNTIEEDRGQYDDEKEIFWATGACMGIRASTFHEAGGFDENMFAHMEEIDLCWRLKNLGYKIRFTPLSCIYHVGGGTLPNEHPMKMYLNFRNNLILLYKNLPSDKLIIVLFSRLILDGIAALKFLFTFKFKYFFSVCKAHFIFYGMTGKYRSFRKTANIPKTLPGEFYPKSIIFQYFFKKKQTFRDLNF